MQTAARKHATPLGGKLLITLMAIGLIAALVSASETSKMVVIVNRDNPVSELSLLEVRYIFLGDQKRWKDGSEIEVLLPRSGSPAMRAILTNVFRMRSVAELGQYYMAAIFQHKVSAAPPTVSTKEAIKIVSSSTHALAVVPHEDAIDKSGIKIIAVEGL